MNKSDTPHSLDPEDWDEYEEAYRQAIDVVIKKVKSIRDRRVWTPTDDRARSLLEAEAPDEPVPLNQLVDEFDDVLSRHGYGNDHPRFWGWVVGNGTPAGLLGETLAGSMNINTVAGDNSAILAELRVLEWFRDRFGMPESTSGIMVTGGSVANLVGTAIGLRHVLGSEYETGGVSALDRTPRIYSSVEAHNSVDKAARLLGLGTDNLVKIPVDDEFGLRFDVLEEAVKRDMANGLRPAVIVGTAGTVNTGAMDPIGQMADLASEHGLWFHVDGAFGSLAALSPRYRHLTRGIERADSLAFDLHKWLHTQYDSGCVLVRDIEAHRAAFSVGGAYMNIVPGILADGGRNFSLLGLELSRGARGLKAWFHLRAHGFNRLTAMIERNIEQARALADLVSNEEDLQLMAPVSLNIVCFRFKPAGSTASDEELSALNRDILVELHQNGIVAPSYTTIDGAFVIRASFTNHRTTDGDVRTLVSEVIQAGRRREAA